MLRGAEAFCSLDMIQGYWQTRLHETAQDLFTVVTTGRLFTPTQVPQGVLKATGYFPDIMAEVLDGLFGRACMVWVEDVAIWGRDADELLRRLEAVLGRLTEHGLVAAAHKAVCYQREIKWCGILYSDQATLPDPDRIQGLLELRRPETGGELMHFLHAVGWLRCAIPEMANLEAPLREMLEARLDGTKRTRRAADRRMLMDNDWTAERTAAWEMVRERIAKAVPVYYPKEGYRVLVFTDASDLFWGGCVTQVPEEEFSQGLTADDMSHEPLGFVSGAFKNAQVRWPIIDKEAFAIISTCKRMEF